MGLGDALERLDRRVLGRHAEPGPPPRRPVRTVFLFMGLTALAQFLGLLAMGFNRAQAVESLLTYLVTVAIALPLVLLALRRRQKRREEHGANPPR